VYVDQASLNASVGTQAWPFHSIREATTLTAPRRATLRTIHVAAGNYNESGLVTVGDRVTLAGAGESLLTVTGGGACVFAATTCTVTVQGAGKLTGATVTSTTGYPVEIAPGANGATIDHVTARGAPQDGFYVRATATLSNVSALNNTRFGMTGRSITASPITITVTNGTFKGNQMGGVSVDRLASLTFTGGAVESNGLDGIDLGDSSLAAGARQFTVSNLSVKSNLGYGIAVAGTGSLKLRGTTMLGNEAGLVFAQSAGNQLDVGTSADAGNNVFGGVSPGNNAREGLCIEQSGATGGQAAEGDTWSKCPPSSGKSPSSTCHGINTYVDVGYVPVSVTSGSPVAAPASCTVGP